jgi:uncharacterized protein YbaA (DUF1428 family)
MALYVDGFVLPVPKRNAAAYRRLARGNPDLTPLRDAD